MTSDDRPMPMHSDAASAAQLAHELVEGEVRCRPVWDRTVWHGQAYEFQSSLCGRGLLVGQSELGQLVRYLRAYDHIPPQHLAATSSHRRAGLRLVVGPRSRVASDRGTAPTTMTLSSLDSFQGHPSP